MYGRAPTESTPVDNCLWTVQSQDMLYILLSGHPLQFSFCETQSDNQRSTIVDCWLSRSSSPCSIFTNWTCSPRSARYIANCVRPHRACPHHRSCAPRQRIRTPRPAGADRTPRAGMPARGRGRHLEGLVGTLIVVFPAIAIRPVLGRLLRAAVEGTRQLAMAALTGNRTWIQIEG